MGKKRYLNLNSAAGSPPPRPTRTCRPSQIRPHRRFHDRHEHVEHERRTAGTCGAGNGNFVLQASNSANARSTAGRALRNLHDCDYYNAGVTDSSTRSRRTRPTAPRRSGGDELEEHARRGRQLRRGRGGYVAQPGDSGVAPLDTLLNRYVNLHQCTFTIAGVDHYTQIVPSVPTATRRARTRPDTANTGTPTCTPAGGGYPVDATNSAIQALDTLDQARGQHSCSTP